MKIAIISDSHDNLANLNKAIKNIEAEGIKTIIHCGDIASLETLKELSRIFKEKVLIAFGNMDEDYLKNMGSDLKKIPKFKFFGQVGEVRMGKKKIAFTHFPAIAKKLAATQDYDIIFYGHTHKPWEETIGKTRLVNPGNLAGLLYRATFAIYDTKNDELKLKFVI